MRVLEAYGQTSVIIYFFGTSCHGTVAIKLKSKTIFMAVGKISPVKNISR